MNNEEYYKKLVNNIFENLKKSIDCIETDSKTSIICYFSALELLFKARLFKEHWAFILQNIDDRKANMNNLKTGKFLTVSFDSAISRIQNLLQDLDSGYEKYFEDLKNVRNRLVHFDCVDQNDKDLSVKNISKTWYYVYTLLNNKWKDMFIGNESEIADINTRMQKYSEFFWNSKKNALINKFKNKYSNNPLYKTIKIHNKPLVCNYCEHSYDKDTDLNLMRARFDYQTFTLTKTCDICEHEDYLFLFSFYMQKNKSIILIKDEFKKFIDNHIWQQSGNNTVNYSHYQTLVDTSAEEINIDFSDIPYLSYDDYEIDYKSIDEKRTEIQLRLYHDFDLTIENCPAYYVLYIYLTFTLNIDKKEIDNSNFAELYNSIDDLKVNFFVDSDGF